VKGIIPVSTFMIVDKPDLICSLKRCICIGIKLNVYNLRLMDDNTYTENDILHLKPFLQDASGSYRFIIPDIKKS